MILTKDEHLELCFKIKTCLSATRNNALYVDTGALSIIGRDIHVSIKTDTEPVPPGKYLARLSNFFVTLDPCPGDTCLPPVPDVSGVDWSVSEYVITPETQGLQKYVFALTGVALPDMFARPFKLACKGQQVTILYHRGVDTLVLICGVITAIVNPPSPVIEPTSNKLLTGIPDALMRALKAHAASQGISVNRLILNHLTTTTRTGRAGGTEI